MNLKVYHLSKSEWGGGLETKILEIVYENQDTWKTLQ